MSCNIIYIYHIILTYNIINNQYYVDYIKDILIGTEYIYFYIFDMENTFKK